MAGIKGSMEDLRTQDLLLSILTDLTALRTAIAAITAKLDADGGVTDTNYAATCNPSALTTTST